MMSVSALGKSGRSPHCSGAKSGPCASVRGAALGGGVARLLSALEVLLSEFEALSTPSLPPVAFELVESFPPVAGASLPLVNNVSVFGSFAAALSLSLSVLDCSCDFDAFDDRGAR